MFLGFIGRLLYTLYITCILRRQKFYLALVWHQIRQVGLRAIPIIVLLNFLVGVVLTHQGINTLTEYGQLHRLPDLIVPVYVRYVGSLITTLIVAGRSGSAFTTEIGSMQLNEEIDAIRSMRVDDASFIILPRFLSTIVMLPILVVLGIVAGIVGSSFIAWFLIDFSPQAYLYNVRSLIDLWVLGRTLLKAFVFGQIISSIGCYRGFCVYSNAQVLGEMTTRSVVECIFWSIVMDGLISTYYSFLNL